MRCTKSLMTTLLALSALFLLGASGTDRSVQPDRVQKTTPPQAGSLAAPPASQRLSASGTQPDAGSHDRLKSAAPNYYLNWWSVNGGGATNVNGTNFDLGLSVGQAAAGRASGTNFNLGVGFWYGVGGGACPIVLPGDLNGSITVTSSDIIVLVNYVFKGGAAPIPCAAAGDANCSGTVTSSDIIVLVNFVFKGGGPPCNVCTIIPSLWSCP